GGGRRGSVQMIEPDPTPAGKAAASVPPEEPRLSVEQFRRQVVDRFGALSDNVSTKEELFARQRQRLGTLGRRVGDAQLQPVARHADQLGAVLLLAVP